MRETADLLTAAVAAERKRERSRRTGEQARQHPPRGGRTLPDRGAQPAGLPNQNLEPWRHGGEPRVTKAAFVLPSLLALFDERGWNGRTWKPVPDLPLGRPWGTHDEHFQTRVAIDLPDERGETLCRACYWASRPAVVRLQSWYTRHGDNWRGRLHNPRPALQRRAPTAADLEQRELLIQQVHTTGRVLREAIDKALNESNQERT